MDSASSEDGYETSDASEEMDLLDMDKWRQILGGINEPEDSRAFERFLRIMRPRLQNFVIDSNNASGTGIGTRLVFVMDEEVSGCHAVRRLSSHNSSRLPDISVTSIKNELCLTCTDCVLLHKVRDRLPIEDEESGYFSTRGSKLEFWADVDSYINAKASQTEDDPFYSITHSLCKSVVLEHHLMHKFKSDIEEQKIQGVSTSIAERLSESSAIQTEELQLADALKHAAGVYRELSLDSNAILKLDMLDVIEEIFRGLRILWVKEVECRKEAMEDN